LCFKIMFTAQHAQKANELRKNTLLEALGINFHVKDGQLWASMSVNQATKQPMGLLHGGATAALAESLGSMSSFLLLDAQTHAPVGTRVSANHLRGVHEGKVHAVGELVHQGQRLHVWSIRVYNDQQKLAATCELTNMIIPAK